MLTEYESSYSTHSGLIWFSYTERYLYRNIFMTDLSSLLMLASKCGLPTTSRPSTEGGISKQPDLLWIGGMKDDMQIRIRLRHLLLDHSNGTFLVISFAGP